MKMAFKFYGKTIAQAELNKAAELAHTLTEIAHCETDHGREFQIMGVAFIMTLSQFYLDYFEQVPMGLPEDFCGEIHSLLEILIHTAHRREDLSN